MTKTLALLIALSFSTSFSDTLFRAEPDLFALRGTWEYRSYYKTWKLDFITDSEMIFNRWDAKYSLIPGTLSITDDGNTTEYPYELSGNELTLTLEDGSKISLHHQSEGELESKLTGKFETLPDSTLVPFEITFLAEDNTSAFALDIGDMVMHGMFRVNGYSLFLAFSDGTVDTAQLHYAAGHETVDRISYGDRMLAQVQPIAEYDLAEIPSSLDELPELVPVCTLYVGPPTPPPVVVIVGGPMVPPAAPTAPADPAPAPVKAAIRDLGSTRTGQHR